MSAAGASEVSAGSGTVGQECGRAEDCDDGMGCNGLEDCTDGVCTAGERVSCSAGMHCIEAQDATCHFSSDAPWIVYLSNEEAPGVREAYAVRSDVASEMTPLKIAPGLKGQGSVTLTTGWTPKGSAAILGVTDTDTGTSDTYLVRFEAGPEEAVLLTDGLPASTFSTARIYSPSESTIGVQREDGYYLIDVADDGSPVPTRISSDGFDEHLAWFKSNDEVLYVGHSALASSWNVILVERQNGAWKKQTLLSGLNFLGGGVTSDASMLFYITGDESEKWTLHRIETVLGSTPVTLAGPVSELTFALAPKLSRFLLLTASATGSDVFGGPIGTLTKPPLIKAGVGLSPSGAIGYGGNVWAPNGMHGLLFEEGAFGARVVIYEPDSEDPWQPMTELEQPYTDNSFTHWSPDSTLAILPTRTSATSDIRLTTITLPNREVRHFDSLPAAEIKLLQMGFSPDGKYFVYPRRGEVAYLDLSSGVSTAPAPKVLGDIGTDPGLTFSGNGTETLFFSGPPEARTCFYGRFPDISDPPLAQVGGGGHITGCRLQPGQ